MTKVCRERICRSLKSSLCLFVASCHCIAGSIVSFVVRARHDLCIRIVIRFSALCCCCFFLSALKRRPFGATSISPLLCCDRSRAPCLKRFKEDASRALRKRWTVSLEHEEERQSANATGRKRGIQTKHTQSFSSFELPLLYGSQYRLYFGRFAVPGRITIEQTKQSSVRLQLSTP